MNDVGTGVEGRATSRTGVRVLGIGGSTRPRSSSEMALRIALREAEKQGAEVRLVTGRSLMLPLYDTESAERAPGVIQLLEAIRSSDAIILSSPGYHGTISGMLKNALDYLEDLRSDARPYLDGMPVGCIAVAYGWQATVSTLQAMRVTTHALRGWPSPLGAAINASVAKFDESGGCSDPVVYEQLRTVGKQIVTFAQAAPRAQESLRACSPVAPLSG